MKIKKGKIKPIKVNYYDRAKEVKGIAAETPLPIRQFNKEQLKKAL